MPHPINRRRLLISSVAGSLALPMLPSLNPARACPVFHAPPVETQQPRFVAVANLLGFQQKHFFPAATGSQYEVTPLLQPLMSQRDQLSVFRGLDHGLRGGHFAVHSFLSGVLHHESKHRAQGNITVDQLIADHVGRQTRFASLTVGSEGGIHGGCQLSWTKSGVRVPPITGPQQLFETLFVSDSPARRERTGRANSLQSSILDSVQSEARELSQTINREDRNKLDEYFSAIRDVETRLVARRTWHDQPKPETTQERPADRNMVEDLPLLYELITLALQTDCTRVATLEIGGSFMPQHLGIEKSYHSLSHHGGDEDTIAKLLKLEVYQMEQFGKFLQRLASIQDGQQTLLDSTAVLLGSGMGNANSHKNSDLPIVLAGGGYQHGQFKRTPDKGAGKVPLCNLLLGLSQRMGVATEQFGTSTGVYS